MSKPVSHCPLLGMQHIWAKQVIHSMLPGWHVLKDEVSAFSVLLRHCLRLVKAMQALPVATLLRSCK